MNHRNPLPRAFEHQAFSAADARREGVGRSRLRASDLHAPFRGIRSTQNELSGVRECCDAYAPRLREGQFFSHTTAALLWGFPIASHRVRALPLHVSVLAGSPVAELRPAQSAPSGPVGADRIPPGLVRAEPMPPWSASAEPVRSGSASAEPVRSGSAGAESLRSGPVGANRMRSGSAGAEPVRSGSAGAEPVRLGSAGAEPVRARAPTARGVVGHTLSDARVSIARRFGHPVTDVCSTWCHVAQFISFDELIAAGDAAVLTPAVRRKGDLRPFTTIDELSRRTESYVGRGKRMLVAALPHIRDGAESPRETYLRLLLVRSGLPEPELNVNVFTSAGGWAGRADLFYRQQRVIVEYDGDQHRTDRDIYENDQVRLERLADADCVVIRVRAEGLGSAAAHTLTRVRRALRSRGPSGLGPRI